MRRILSVTLVVAAMGAFAQSGLAADIPARMGRVAPLTAPAPAFSWTGCYVGGNVGYGWAPTDWTPLGSNATRSHDATGAVGGGQIGCDWQTSNVVFGVEGMFDWSGLSGSSSPSGVNIQTDMNWLATVTGRVGLAIDRALFYVKGGGAWVNEDFGFSLLGVNFRGNDTTQSGWTVGGGVEWSFAPSWSAKLEYNFIDLGGDTPRFCVGGACGRVFNVEQNVHMVTVGLNYRFWGQ